MKNKRQRIVLDIDKELWRKVSIKAAQLSINKRELVEMALERVVAEGDENM